MRDSFQAKPISEQLSGQEESRAVVSIKCGCRLYSHSSLMDFTLCRTLGTLACTFRMAGSQFGIYRSRATKSGKWALGKSIRSHHPALFSNLLGIRIRLESSSPTAIGSDGERDPNVDWRSIRYYHGSDARTKDNKPAHYAIAPGFVIPDHVRLIDSFLCLWLRSATSTPCAGYQLCLC